MASSLFSQLLDVLLAVLLVVFVIVALRRLVWPAEPRRKSLIREKDFDESEIFDVLDERFELREREKQLKSDYLDGRLGVDAFKELHREVALRLKAIDRRLKALGVLD